MRSTPWGRSLRLEHFGGNNYCLASEGPLVRTQLRDGRLYVRACPPLGRLVNGLGWWPSLAGMLADEGGSDFHHRGVVPVGVAGCSIALVYRSVTCLARSTR
jgi:hypothetical protein